MGHCPAWLLGGLLAFASGCVSAPPVVTVRDPAGNMLARMDTKTGAITLTWAGVRAIQPRIVFPEQGKR